MKNFKKVLALVLAVACLLSFAAVASANNAIKTSEVYDDAASISAEYKEALDVLTAIGVLDGKGSSFKPKDTLKRSEAAKIIAVFANTDPEINGLYASANPFTDVPANHWAVSYIAYAYKTGIIAGVKDGVFAPDARLTGIQFLKMVLCTLGFDAHEEGLVGNSWKVNTLQLAKNTGLTTVLGNGFNYDTELTRDAAAQIMLNALNAHTVYYGSENKVAASRNAYTTVAGAVANNEFMYQRWNLTKIANNVTDDFYRPAHEWMYNGVKFDALYTDAPLASYNVKVAGCNILNDAIFDLTNPVGTKTLKVYTNGALTGTTTIVDTTELKYGAQGQLTEIYPDRIVHIDTYLAQVYSVMAGRIDNNGHIYRDANVHAEVFVGTNGPVGYTKVKLPFVTEGFTKDQFVRVTKSFKGGEHIVTMDAVETKQGIFNGYTGDMLNGFSQMKVAEEFLNVANCFGYNITRNNIYNWMGIDVVTFMDQYGNVLGIDKYWAALNYGVIDALWIGTENGQPVIKADIVTVGGETLSAVTVSQITRNGSVDKAADFVTKYPNLTLAAVAGNGYGTGVIGDTETISAQYAQAFAPYYDRLAFYVVNGAGQYELNLDTNGRFDDETTDHFGALTNVVYAKGGDKVAEFTNNYAWAQEVTTTNGQTSKKSLIPMNADTVILVRNAGTEVPFASRIANGYTSYTGYANVPSMTAYGVSYHINTETRYADVVYVYEVSVTGTKATVFYAGDPIAALPLSYDALGNTIYNYQVIVYVVDEATGALSKATYTMALDERLENGTMTIPAPAIGFHTAYVSANNEISFGIDNANYDIANANFGGNNVTGTVSATYTENPMLGYNAFEISLGNGTEIFNTNATTSSCVFATTFDPSEVATVADIQNDVHFGDKVYVYQNANNPVNPIYAVVVEYAQANITVYYNGHAVAADAVENYIWRFDCAAQNRTWEDLSVEAKFGYQIVDVTNKGESLVKLPNGLYHDMTVDATVGDIAVYVKNADNIDNSNLIEYTNGPVRAVNQNGAKQLYVYAGTGINVTELLNELNGYNGRIYLNGNASVAVLRNGFNGEEALGSDTVSTGFVVRVTAENGVNFSDYYVVVAG